MAFCLPFSTALTLLFSGLGVLLSLFGFDWSSFKRAMRHPISIFCVALFAWLSVSMLWSIAPADELVEGISKYRKLLFVPLVAMLLISIRVKPWFLMNFFVIGCLVVCIGSLLSSSGVLEYLIGPQLPSGGWGLGGNSEKHWFYIGPPEAPTFGRAWIAQGAFLVFSASYLVAIAVAASISKRLPKARSVTAGSIGSVFVLIYVSLNLGGRTGYLLLVCSVVIWLFFLWRCQKRIAMLTVLLSFTLLCGSHMVLHSKVLERINNAIHDVSSYVGSNALTSQGLRLRFWAAGVHLGMQRPLVGWGVGSYAEGFSRDKNQPLALQETRPHPHSEYVLLLVQGGGVAFATLVGLTVFVTREAITNLRKPCSSRSIVWCGLLVPCLLLLIDGLFNSIIWDLAEGHALSILISPLITRGLSTKVGANWHLKYPSREF